LPPALPFLERILEGRAAPAAILLALSAATLAGALLFQYAGGLVPCELCLYERYPHEAIIAAALIALLLRKRRARGGALLLAALAASVGTGLAFYHIGVERHWWEGSAACTGSIVTGAAHSLEALRQQILNTPVARCDRVSWSLFGLSLAGYNFLISLALALFALLAGRRALGRGSR